MELPIPAASLTGGTVRVTFDLARPVDPASRKLIAPVRRAGIRLREVEVGP